MAETVEVPGIGAQPKTWVYGGLAAVGGVLLFVWYRNHRASSSAVSDPNAANDAVGAGSYTPPTIVDSNQSTNNSGQTFTSDAQWVQAAVDALSNQGSWDPSTVTKALSLWLAGQGLTDTQKEIVIEAKGIEGLPPSGDHPMKTALPAPTTQLQRKDQPNNTLALNIGRATGSWESIVRHHYNISGATQSQIGTAWWDLAHYNGHSGNDDPVKLKINILLPQYLRTS